MTITGIEMLIAGAAGGFVKTLVEQKGRVMFPIIEKSDSIEYVHLGAITNIILGAIVAYYTTLDPAAAFTTGITAVFFVEKILERTTVGN